MKLTIDNQDIEITDDLKSVIMQHVKDQLKPRAIKWSDLPSLYKNTLMVSEKSSDRDYKFVTFARLMDLREYWLDTYANGWQPDWTGDGLKKWVIKSRLVGVQVDCYTSIQSALSFPTHQMAQEFLEAYRSEIEGCKDII